MVYMKCDDIHTIISKLNNVFTVQRYDEIFDSAKYLT